MVVGTGNKIYASLSPRDMGDTDYPYICIIEQYGELDKDPIPVVNSNLPIDFLAQNSRGEIFFGTSKTGEEAYVFRLNPKTEIIEEIFNHNNPDSGIFEQPIKVDEDNYLYFIIKPRQDSNSAKFYSISRTGYERWSHTFSSDCGFTRSTAAIDIERNQVYFNYYNDSVDKSYLICFNRSNGNVKWSGPHEFPGSHTEAAMAGAPAIGENGTIYVGCSTSLYALYPTTGNEKWNLSFDPAYTHRTPAIGRDGTLYVNYGKLISGVWHPGFIRAVDPSNGSIKWEREISPALEPSDSMDDIYAAGNEMVGFTYSRSGVNHTGGLRDNGSSGEILWDATYGGKMIFGPGQTIYVIPSSGDASIYALSVGERGDPDGLGMAFTNNEAPLMPSNPTPADSTQDVVLNVALSWDCTDPESHDLKYSLFVGESGYDMVPVATNVVEKSYMLSGLKAGTGYTWKIIATDGQAVTEGPTWVFSTLDAMYHPADPNNDYVISMLEILGYIDEWAVGNVSMLEVLEAIDLWAAGQYYWDESEQKFKPGEQP